MSILHPFFAEDWCKQIQKIQGGVYSIEYVIKITLAARDDATLGYSYTIHFYRNAALLQTAASII